MAHYYDADPQGPYKTQEIATVLRGVPFTIISASGLFSVKHIDAATYLLIENARIAGNERVLDLGCGYGIVGLAIKRLFPETKVVLADVNALAVQITRKNAKKLDLDVTTVRCDICQGIEGEFDAILTNPPYVAGRAVCFGFIEQSFDHLSSGGTLQLVARHNKGGKTLCAHMESVFGNVETLVKQGGFRVYLSTKE